MADHEIDNLIVNIESKAEDTGDGISKLQETIARLKNTIAESAPELDGFLQKIKNMRAETQNFTRAQQKTGYEKSIEDARNLTSELKKMADAEKTASQIEMERMQNEIRLNNELAKSVPAKRSNQTDASQMAAEMAKAQREAVPLIDSLERMDALYKSIDEAVQRKAKSDVTQADVMGYGSFSAPTIDESLMQEADALGIARQEIDDYVKSLYEIYSAESSAADATNKFASATREPQRAMSDMMAESKAAQESVTAYVDTWVEASDAVDRFGKKAEKIEFYNNVGASTETLQNVRDEILSRDENIAKIKEEKAAVDSLNASKSAVASTKQTDAFASVRASAAAVTSQQRASREAQDQVTEAVKGTNKEIKKSQSETKKAHKETTGWLSNLLKVTKRIIISRLIRSALNSALNGAKEGLQNIVHYSDEANKAMSTLATDSQYLKNSFAALATPILTLVAPVLDFLTDKIVDVSNKIAEFFAALNGNTTYTRALKESVNYVDTLADSTTKAAKAQRQLIGGFDELNIFQSKDKDSGKSKSSEKDYAKMFETANVSGDIVGVADKVKGFISASMPLFEGFADVVGAVASAVKGFADTYFLPWLEALGQFAKDNPDALYIIGEGIAFVVGAIAVSKMVRAATQLGSMANSLASITLAISGFAISFSGAKGIVNGDYSAENFLKIAIGAALGFGAGVLAFGFTPAGIAIGIIAALTVTIGSFVLASKQKAQEEFDNSEFGKQYHELMDKLSEREEVRRQINIAVDVAMSDFQSELEKWQGIEALINEAFTLSYKDVKTPEEIEKIKNNIKAIDNLTLGKIQLEFDDTTGKITEEKAAVDELVKSLKNKALTEASERVLKDLYEQQVQAILEQKRAEDLYHDAIRNSMPILNEQAGLKKEEKEIEDRLLELRSGENVELDTQSTKYDELQAKLYEVQAQLKKNAPYYLSAQQAISEANAGVKDAKATLDSITDDIEYLSKKPWEINIKFNYEEGRERGRTNDVKRPWVSTGYADGGYPTRGEIFVARESGPEYVGSIGGATAVANNDDIVDGISGGVSEALAAYIPMIVQAIEDNRAEVNIGDDEIARSAARGGRSIARQTGTNVFA